MKGFVVWLTGLPASGKTTIAKALAGRLRSLGVTVVVLDSDEMRSVLTPNPTYSPGERDWFYGVVAWLATHLSESGVNVVIAATGNRRRYRDAVRRSVPRFAEVYLKCPLDVCIRRDRKGVYRLAMEGRAKTVPGIQEPYDEPLSPELTIETDRVGVEEAVARVLDLLISRKWVSGG